MSGRGDQLLIQGQGRHDGLALQSCDVLVVHADPISHFAFLPLAHPLLYLGLLRLLQQRLLVRIIRHVEVVEHCLLRCDFLLSGLATEN